MKLFYKRASALIWWGEGSELHMSRNMRFFQQCCMCGQQRYRPACAYAQSDQSLCWSLEYSMTLTLLREHHLEFLSSKGGCTGSSECTFVKMPHCWTSHVSLLSSSSLILHANEQMAWMRRLSSDHLLIVSAIIIYFSRAGPNHD